MTEKSPEDLSNVILLSDLPQAEMRRLEQACSFKHYSAQEQIIDRQSETTDVFFVIDGKVRVVNYSLSGREITLDDLSAGGYFGELAAIDGQPRSASVMALSDCLVAALPQERFLATLEKYPKLTFRVMRTLTRIVRSATDRIMDLSTLAANNRVHADLLRLARAHMAGKNESRISPIPNHSDIASRASTTRETVARVLSELAKHRIVERQKDTLVIHNVQQLSEMVEQVRG